MPTFRNLMGQFKEEDREKALGCLARLGIEQLAYRRAETLSGGEQQRAAFARAMLQGCRVLLADEPVANLDPKTAEEVLFQLEEITRENGLCTLAVMHQPELLRRHCSRVLGIKDGVIVYDGKADIDEQDLDYIYGREAANSSKVA
jgi:phosphonate transport system ATP-binding protein